MLRLICTICFVISTVGAFGQDTLVFQAQPDWKKGFDLSSYTWMLDDDREKATTTFPEIKHEHFVPYVSTPFRYSENPTIIKWLRFTLRNTSTSDSLHFILHTNAHYLETLYNNDGEIARNGISVRHGQADRSGLDISLQPASTQTFWLRIEERVRYLSPLHIHLETTETYAAHSVIAFHQERWLRFALPMMVGILLLVSVFGLYQYYLFRESAFLYYFLYGSFAFLFALLCFEERLNLALFSSAVVNVLDGLMPAGIVISYCLFVSHMVDIPSANPRGWRLLKALMVVSVFQSFLVYAEHLTGDFFFESNFYYSYLTGVPALVTSAVLLIFSWRSKNPVRRFIVIGLACLITFYFLPLCIGFSSFYNLPYHLANIVNYGPFFFVMGIMLEAICFAFALAYRGKLISDENHRLHLHYTRKLENDLDKRTEEIQQQNKVLESQRIKQLQTEFDHRIAETEMIALRAQMNPHFIFNCLNSIKLYTLENDSKTASEYLTIFSQLIRQVLENSTSEKVTLENELETLRLYMEMEAMRFKSKVQYTIDIDPDIDASYVEIPPLLLQPYVENAIWHGLMQKKEGGAIHIQVKQKSIDVILITITDNGIGRERAEEYKSKSVTRQKSFGMKLTSERISMINQMHQSKTSVEVIDRVDSMNQPCGTQVLVEIPL